jgi:hypothetical protein
VGEAIQFSRSSNVRGKKLFLINLSKERQKHQNRDKMADQQHSRGEYIKYSI